MSSIICYSMQSCTDAECTTFTETATSSAPHPVAQPVASGMIVIPQKSTCVTKPPEHLIEKIR